MLAASLGVRALAAFAAYLVIALSVREPLPVAAPFAVLALDLVALGMAIRHPGSTRALRVAAYVSAVLDLAGTAIAFRYLQLRHEVVGGNIHTIVGAGRLTQLAEFNTWIVAAAMLQIMCGAVYAVVALMAFRAQARRSACGVVRCGVVWFVDAMGPC